jgi:hypothetical protein
MGRPDLNGVDRCPSWPRGHLQSDPQARVLGRSTEDLKSRARQRPQLSRGGAGRWAEVFSLEAAQQLIDSGTLSSAHFDFVREGDLVQGLSRTRLEGAVARRALRKRCTVLLRNLERVWPGTRDLAVGLSSELEEEVQVNAYLTPGDEVGLPRHADHHDVIVLQLHGSKQWQVLDGAGESVVEVSLVPGDLLYVPRGWPHEVRADSLSLHLTIGLLGPGREELHHPALDDVARAVHATRLARSQTCAPPAVDLGAPSPAPPALDTMLVRTAPLFAAALERDGRTALVFGGRRVDGPISLRDAFRFIADHPSFRPSELPGPIDEGARRELVECLVAEGLLAAG